MIKVFFFAQVRELTGTEQMMIDEACNTVGELRHMLSLRGQKWQQALDAENILMAVNHTLVTGEHQLYDGDEVAFFPPVTGG